MNLNLNSPKQLSALIFGGCIEEKVSVLVGIYKTGKRQGQPKFKIEKIRHLYKGLGVVPKNDWKTKISGVYQTNEEVLEQIDHLIIEKLLEIRKLGKLISTYYNDEFVYPDNRVHQNINLTSTDTGRTSATKPNTQNQPQKAGKLIKSHFVSRFEAGLFVKIDYSQIEIVIQAQLSQDKKYMSDVLVGVDFHTKRLALKEVVDYETTLKKIKVDQDPKWIKKRSQIKAFSFSRAYGAGAAKISKDTGLRLEEVKTLIKNEDLEYAGLKAYNDALISTVESNAGYTSCAPEIGWYNSPTGRKYVFTSQLAPDWLQQQGIMYSFKPTMIKNYMIQGTARDIAGMMIGKFWRDKAIYQRDKYLMINFVHDELDIDCKKEYIEQMKQDVQVLTQVSQEMLRLYNYKWELSLNIDIKYGKSWAECE